MISKTYTKNIDQKVEEFLEKVVAQAQTELSTGRLHVIDCPASLSEKVMTLFKCPVQLSTLDDGLTFHVV